MTRRRVYAVGRAAVLVAVPVAVPVALLVAQLATCRSREPTCREAAKDGTDAVIVLVCEPEYTQTNDPDTGVKLANALRRSGKLDTATVVANGLLATPARADALQILGRIAIEEKRYDAARMELAAARAQHEALAQHGGLALDDQSLAGIANGQKQFGDALRYLHECTREARAAADAVIEGYCHVSAGRVLGDAGYFDEAHRELDLAEPLFHAPRDLAWLEITRGELDQLYVFKQSYGDYTAMSIGEFESAIEHAREARRPSEELGAQLNLIYSLTAVGRLADARRELDAARALDVDHAQATTIEMLEAQLAYRQGHVAQAYALNAEIVDRIDDDDYQIRILAMQTRIALGSGDLAGAERWARRNVDAIEKIRAAQSGPELRPWIMSIRRQPYELLFTVLARAHRYDEALRVLDRWQGHVQIDAMGGVGSEPLDPAAIPAQIERRRDGFLSLAQLVAPAPPAALDRLRDVELVAVLTADNEVWRVTARHGAIDIADLGPSAAFLPAITGFRGAPTDPAVASIGAAVLGADVFRATGEPLFVMLPGELAAMPVAALRVADHPDRPLIALRPIVHVARLADLDCAPAPRPGDARRAVVLGDAAGDLPNARAEALAVAKLLGVPAQVGAAATSDALFGAAGADILHVAVHGTANAGVGSLALHDRALTAFDIASRTGGPALVVLSACDSAVADDGGVDSALTTAFLASGSRQVIGTLRPVSDRGALDVMTALYGSGGGEGVADPVTALANVQGALSRTANVDWPSFGLYGHDICRKGH